MISHDNRLPIFPVAHTPSNIAPLGVLSGSREMG